VWGTPKNHRERTVVLPQFINDRVAAHLTRTAGGPNDLVFTAPGGGPLRVSNFRKKVWLPATAASNSPAGLRVHDLRHTAASLAISAGASIKAVQQMCGHSSVTITLDLYAHLYQDDLKSLARSMHDRYSEIDAA
ncbi:MAG: tyrosine-type recombinase/integrase, partial [Acidimicrobiia bacterium]|nr:tyrosine-type recombinase/integrase [Acidimicrobiia bacterium]